MSEIRVRGAIYRGRTVESIARRVWGRRAEVLYGRRLAADTWTVTVARLVGRDHPRPLQVLAHGVGYGRTERPELD